MKTRLKGHWNHKEPHLRLKTGNAHFACKRMNSAGLKDWSCSWNQWGFIQDYLAIRSICDFSPSWEVVLFVTLCWYRPHVWSLLIYSLQGASSLPEETETAVWNKAGDELSILIGSTWRRWRVCSGNQSVDICGNQGRAELALAPRLKKRKEKKCSHEEEQNFMELYDASVSGQHSRVAVLNKGVFCPYMKDKIPKWLFPKKKIIEKSQK